MTVQIPADDGGTEGGGLPRGSPSRAGSRPVAAGGGSGLGRGRRRNRAEGGEVRGRGDASPRLIAGGERIASHHRKPRSSDGPGFQLRHSRGESAGLLLALGRSPLGLAVKYWDGTVARCPDRPP